MDKTISFNLGSVETGTKQKATKYTEYISEGAYNCKVLSVETSATREDYGGAPYVMFNIKSGEKLGRAKFWAIRESDKSSTKEWKAKQLKEFLINCGVTDFTDDAESIKQAVGKKVNITFIYEEYVTNNRETDEPIIRKAIKYRWSSKDGTKIAYKEEYNQPLSKEDMKDYMDKRDEFSTNSTNVEDDDPLPFQVKLTNFEVEIIYYLCLKKCQKFLYQEMCQALKMEKGGQESILFTLKQL